MCCVLSLKGDQKMRLPMVLWKEKKYLRSNVIGTSEGANLSTEPDGFLRFKKINITPMF
jgi:hypothetical protein